MGMEVAAGTAAMEGDRDFAEAHATGAGEKAVVKKRTICRNLLVVPSHPDG